MAGVAGKIAELGLNIDDISQTVLDEFFHHDGGGFFGWKEGFYSPALWTEAYGESLQVKINIQSAAIFDAMHNL